MALKTTKWTVIRKSGYGIPSQVVLKNVTEEAAKNFVRRMGAFKDLYEAARVLSATTSV